MNAPVSPLHRVFRVSARVTGTALLGMVAIIVIGEGLPNLFLQPGRVQLEFMAMGIMLLGLILAWVYEGLGGLMVLLGLLVFNVVELVVNNRLAMGAFPYFAVPGVLYLLSSLMERTKTSVGGTTNPSHELDPIEDKLGD